MLPRERHQPTMPFTVQEMRALLRAAESKRKRRGLLLLMRYSGLAISSAATLAGAKLDGTGLTLRWHKSGRPVTVDLPEVVLRAIQPLRGSDPRYFWWTGRGLVNTAAKYWRQRLNRVARQAGIEGFRTYRLRDTFAVSMLAGGAKLQDLKELLGHSSVRTTEKYNAPWDRSRRKRHRRVVRDYIYT